MHPGMLGARHQRALERLVSAAEGLGERYGLTHLVENVKASKHRDKKIEAMQQTEAVANLLEALEAIPGPDHSGTLDTITVADMRERVKLIESVETLRAMLEDEQGGRGRKGVAEAIAARIEELEASEQEGRKDEEAEDQKEGLEKMTTQESATTPDSVVPTVPTPTVGDVPASSPPLPPALTPEPTTTRRPGRPAKNQ